MSVVIGGMTTGDPNLNAPLLTLSEVSLGFSGPELFSELSLSIHYGQRACLVGRNGSGKSTLMKVLAGLEQTDSGERVVQPHARIAYLDQSPDLTQWDSVEEAVLAALSSGQEDRSYLALSYIKQLGLSPQLKTAQLSGGEGRKVALARVFASDPHLLLLDEPTNHLDLPSIEWLENELTRLSAAVILISHDRSLLERTTDRTLWVERGMVRQLSYGFKRFEQWREEVYHDESRQLEKMDKLLIQETQWLREGISARRTRNQGRLRRLIELRTQRASMRARQGTAALQIDAGERSGRQVIEAQGISKKYGDRHIVAPLDLSISRGDRIGIVGPNGAGKTTLIKMLCGELDPDTGDVKLGTQLKPVYIDQRRTLDPELTLQEVLCVSGSDRVMVRGQPIHVAGYLKDFLFEGRDARRRVKSLSGGERARLLLAQQLTEPANLLILDEPTNDLDLETLDLLQELLSEYEGTLLMVSHDRDFLDKIVTSILAFEGEGNVVEYAGGYTDMLSQRKGATISQPIDSVASSRKSSENKIKTKLSYKEQRALESLKSQLDTLSEDVAQLEQTLEDADLYQRDPDLFNQKLKQLEAARQQLEHVEEQWLELELLREELEG